MFRPRTGLAWEVAAMAWKWYAIDSYKASIGSASASSYYGAVQLTGAGFYALLTMVKAGALPAASAPVVAGQQRFYGSMDFQQMAMLVDLVRNEKPVQFGWLVEDPNQFHLMTGSEPVGEGDGLLART
ncbi:MAG: hypothetical protein MUF35_01810 [Candidatus Nanopelagicales bacterium]|jgi:hypothetical protein|nr:hypothetical protein [Candidatus Nanopelagicales bacterium]